MSLKNLFKKAGQALCIDIREGFNDANNPNLYRDVLYDNPENYTNVDSSDVVGNVALTHAQAKRISATKNTFKS